MHARQLVLLSGQQVREGRGRTCRCIADDVVVLQSFYLYDIVSRQMLHNKGASVPGLLSP